MNDPSWILNPLHNPLFWPVVWRTLALYAIGFLLVIALNKGRLTGLWSGNIGKRYLSWLVIGPVYLLAVFLGGDVALVFLLCVIFMALKEVERISKIPHAYFYTLCALAVWSVFVVSYKTDLFYTLPLLYFGAFTTLTLHENNSKQGLTHCSLSLFVAIWIIFSLSHFVLIGHLNNTIDSSKALLLLLGFAVPLSDIFAYFVGNAFKGSWLDKFKIASRLSPNKTYIGVLGNILGAGLGIWMFYFWLSQYLPWWHWIIMAILMGVMGVVGDITESLFKRRFGVKDSGTLLPGHGGVLDRIDSVLRVVVVLYYYLLFFM